LRVVDVIERLNLCEAVREGILRHSSRAEPSASLEGRIVRLVDRIAYINHDIDDALRAGVIGPSDLPREEIAVLGPSGSARIDRLVHDLVEHSGPAGDIVQGEEVGAAMASLRAFMFAEVYLGDTAREEHERIDRVLSMLFEWFRERPEELPRVAEGGDEADRVIDYLAGMTDRFAIRAYSERAVPRGFSGV
jgi:dGTPase